MDITGEEMEVKEIIKVTVVRDALWTQMVIVGHMVSGYHTTTLANHVPPRNPATKMSQHVPTPWGASGGTSTTSLSYTDRGSNLGKLIKFITKFPMTIIVYLLLLPH